MFSCLAIWSIDLPIKNTELAEHQQTKTRRLRVSPAARLGKPDSVGELPKARSKKSNQASQIRIETIINSPSGRHIVSRGIRKMLDCVRWCSALLCLASALNSLLRTSINAYPRGIFVLFSLSQRKMSSFHLLNKKRRGFM
jgi:hypothetical protein